MIGVILNGLKAQGIEILPGLTGARVQEIEAELKTPLPQDLKAILIKGVPHASNDPKLFPDWSNDYKKELKTSQAWVEEAFTFDIENGSYWSDLFGKRPNDVEEAKKQALDTVRTWAPLVRVYGHRFMPTMPNEAGNPVFSVHQACDTVYYGVNLVDYFNKEFGLNLSNQQTQPKGIPNWDKAFFEFVD